jgi:hypothetical protein
MEFIYVIACGVKTMLIPMFNLECKKINVISPSWNLNGDYMNHG